MSAPVILITRAEPEATALAKFLRPQGWAPLVWPLLHIAPVGTAPSGAGVQAVLMTSANAARTLPASRLVPLPSACLCVGTATAKAAEAAGYHGIATAGGDAAALARHAEATLDPAAGALLFLRGETVAGGLAEPLRQAGFTLREAVVYRAEAAEAVPAPVMAALERGDIVAATFYSPRAAAIFAGLTAAPCAGLGRTTAIAISGNAAAPLDALGFGAVTVAARPDALAMQDAIAQAFPGRGDKPVGGRPGAPLS